MSLSFSLSLFHNEIKFYLVLKFTVHIYNCNGTRARFPRQIFKSVIHHFKCPVEIIRLAIELNGFLLGHCISLTFANTEQLNN